MRTICLILAVLLLCTSCTARRQEGTQKQENSSAQELIQTDRADSSSSEAAASSQAESAPVAVVPPPPAEAAAAAVAAISTPVQTISSFDVEQARIQPTCYLPERESFLSCSYYDSCALCLVGFSPDGKIAFLKEVTLDGKGGTDLSFVVQDLVSDEILWELKAPSDDDYTLRQDLHKRFIADYGSQIDKKLSEYGIVISPCEYKSLPYRADGLSLSVAIESHDTGKLMYDMFNVTSYSCIVTDGKGRSKKVIADREFMGPEAFACGCVKSPYEDRLAIVVVEATYGFEGCDLLVQITGCDLKKGF